MRDAALAVLGLIEVTIKLVLLILISLPMIGVPLLILADGGDLHHFTRSVLWDKIR